MRPRLRIMQASLFLSFISLYFTPRLLMVASQQSYPSSHNSIECTRFYPDNAGYLCERSYPSCETLAYFRVQTDPSVSLSSIARQLFNTTPYAIANASSLSSYTADLKPREGLYIPFTCTCNGNFSSYNTTYTIMPGDSFVKIANLTYQGLTTCQAIQYANPQSPVTDLKIGHTLILPLRCACPSPAQKHNGIKFLVTYPVGSVAETISSVIDMFAVDRAEFLSANKIMNASQTLFAATTVLLPFKEKPTLPPNASFIPSPSFTSAPTSPTIPEIKEHIAVAVTVASTASIGIIILVLIAIAASCIAKRFQRKHVFRKTFLRPNAIASPNVLPVRSHKPQVNLSQGMSDLATTDRLIIYRIDEIYQATQGFHVSARIKGALYRGTIKDRNVAVKKMERDVSKEVHILQMLHHSSIISLLGFCIASPNESYLVYEYAENGSLYDWLHGHTNSQGLVSSLGVLACREQLQIALDIALAMEYMHDHTYPRFVHRNINSDNILLDSKMRGKIANFASATAIEEPQGTHRQARDEEYTSHEHAMRTKVSSKLTSHEHVMHTRKSTKVTSQEHDQMLSNVSPEVDVYAFGEVLMEMLKRKDNPECTVSRFSNTQDVIFGSDAKQSLRAWIDTCIEDNDVHRECACAVATLAQSCLAHDVSARPSARNVAFALSKLLEVCLSRQ